VDVWFQADGAFWEPAKEDDMHHSTTFLPLPLSRGTSRQRAWRVEMCPVINTDAKSIDQQDEQVRRVRH
jgi:hypothetical protein